MKFYRVVCYTPFVGEESDCYIKSYHEGELRRQIDDCVYENASNWYDDQTLKENDMSEDDYYADCGASSVKEISKEEYLKHCPWDRKVI